MADFLEVRKRNLLHKVLTMKPIEVYLAYFFIKNKGWLFRLREIEYTNTPQFAKERMFTVLYDKEGSQQRIDLPESYLLANLITESEARKEYPELFI